MTDKEKYLSVCKAILSHFDFGGFDDFVQIANDCKNLELDLNDEIDGCFEWLYECGANLSDKHDLCGIFYKRLANRFNALVKENAIIAYADYFCSFFELYCWDEEKLTAWLKDNYANLSKTDKNLVEFVCDDLDISMPKENNEE